jgi:hypothetical protein
MPRAAAAKPFKMADAIAQLDAADRCELERLLYVPGKPNFAEVRRVLMGMGFTLGKDAIAQWWRAEGQKLYRFVPAEGAMHRLLGVALDEYLECSEWLRDEDVRERRRTALQMMAGKEDGGPDKGVLAVGRHMRELEKTIRTTAAIIHNAEVREAKHLLIRATAQQTLDYILQAMHSEGLEQVNPSNLESIGDAAIARIAAENGMADAKRDA